MKSFIALLLCASLLALPGCGKTTPPGSLNGPSAVATRAGVKMTLKLDRTVYKKEQPVWAEVVIENTGSAPVLWTGGCRGVAFVDAIVPTSPGAPDAGEAAARLRQRWQEELRRDEQQRFTNEVELEARAQGADITCPGSVEYRELKPGETLRTRAAWDQQLTYYPQKLLASPGRYAVQASFFMGDRQLKDPLTVQTEIELAGDRPKMIDRLQALDAALADQRVLDWLHAHTGEAVARQENGQWLLLEGDIWTRAGDQLGKSEAERTPDGSAVLQDGKWVVHLARYFGPSPRAIDATVNAQTGKVENVTFAR